MLLIDDERLAPEDLAALVFLRLVRPERIPWWAAQWLTQGHDGESLRELAGEHGNDLLEIERLLPRSGRGRRRDARRSPGTRTTFLWAASTD